MAIENHSDNLVYFRIGNIGYAIRASELTGVALDCPVLSYPGLPPEVRGILHWNGKIFPILSSGTDREADLGSTFLIFTDLSGVEPLGVGVAVSGDVRVYHSRSRAAVAKSKVQGPVQLEVRARLLDDRGVEALEVSFSGVQLSQTEVKKLAA